MVDIDKEIVDFQFNYDEKELELMVMLIWFLNLLVNGLVGIVVGMVINILLYNLSELINVCIVLIDNLEIDVDGLMEYILGLDFLIVGIINGIVGIVVGYCIGCGCVCICVKVDIEVVDNGCELIIVIEIFYQVNKVCLIEKIVELVKEKKIEGISELCDEFDKDGMCIYIEIKCGEFVEVVLNNLYQQIQMELVFGINMVVLVDGCLQLMNLKQMLEVFVCYCCEVVICCIVFELCKVCVCVYVLEGLIVVLVNIDEMIELIKILLNLNEVCECMLVCVWELGLVGVMLGVVGVEVLCLEDLFKGVGLVEGGYQLIEIQVIQILEMCLYCLIGLEQDCLIDEYKQLLEVIVGLIYILEDFDCLLQVICEELVNVKVEFGDECCIEICYSEEDLDILDLIVLEDVVVIVFYVGYVKCQLVSVYCVQCRGGCGCSVVVIKEEDFIEQLWLVNMYDMLLIFISLGKVFWLLVYQLLEVGFNVCGCLIINWILLELGECVQVVLLVCEYVDGQFVFFVMKNGMVKKILLGEFVFCLVRGKIVINFDEGDVLVGVGLIDGQCDILLFVFNGKIVCFGEDKVCLMGCIVIGVCGIKMLVGEEVVSLIVVESVGGIEDENEDDNGVEEVVVMGDVVIDGVDDSSVQYILIVIENGYGK